MGRFLHHTAKKKTKQPQSNDITSYDTGREETSTPQKVREGNEPEAVLERLKKSKEIESETDVP